MKRILISAIFISVNTFLFSQERIVTKVLKEKNDTLLTLFNDYKLLSFSSKELKQKVKLKESFDFVVDNQPFNLTLEPNNMFSSSYVAIKTTKEGKFLMPKPEVITYKGFCNNNPNNRVRLTIDENFVSGFIVVNEDKYIVASLSLYSKSESKDKFIFCKESDLKNENIDIPLACNHEDIEENLILPEVEKENSKVDMETARARTLTTNYFLEIATEADEEFYALYGVNSNNVILSIINQAEDVYESTFGLEFLITYQGVYTSNDPYSYVVTSNDGDTAYTQASAFRDEFIDYWEDNMQNIHRDFTCLFTNRDLYFAGIAGWFNAICADPSRSYLVCHDNAHFMHQVTLFDHELGHLFGGYHGHGINCTGGSPTSPRVGSVMCGYMQYNANPLFFSSSGQNTINNHISSNNSCLVSDLCDVDLLLDSSPNISGINAYGGYKTITTLNSTNVSGVNTKLILTSKEDVILNSDFSLDLGAELYIETGFCFETN